MNELVRQSALNSFSKGIYAKNIHYIFGTGTTKEEFAMIGQMAGNPGKSAWLIQKSHQRIGIQMQVSRQVSDDLIASDFSSAAKVEDMPWPARVIEMYFEDPLLPTLLIQKTSPRELEKLFPLLEVEGDAQEYIIALMQEGTGELTSQMLSLQLRPEMYDEFLHEGVAPAMQTGPFSSVLSDDDNRAMAYMINLALKVLAFASVPMYKPAGITRKQMTYGGKPDVKGRPFRPAFQVEYAPKIIQLKKNKDALESKSKDFKGRRGFIRWYRNQRYVNRVGTWDFIAPVINPETGKYPERHILKVRKPNSNK